MNSVVSDSQGLRIDARGVSRSAGSVRLLTSIQFTVLPGEAVALLGPSGAGKSLLLHCLNGYRRPDEGTVLYDGLDPYEDPERFRYRVGYVPQEDIVHTSLAVDRTLDYALRLRRPDLDDGAVARRVDEVIDLLDLQQRRHVQVSRLSGGQRKRVSVGVELVAQPGVLFLDEPTSGLDPGMEERMMDLFRSLARQGRSVLLTTHAMESLDRVDQVALLYSGFLVFFGPVARLLEHFEVTEVGDAFRKLPNRSPFEWARHFTASSLAALAVERPR